MEIEPFESKMPKPPEDGAILKKVYYQVTKNKEDGIETTTRHPMPIYEFPGSPEDESHFLSQASPTEIISNPVKRRRHKELLLADIPDIHYGLRRLPNGELQPTHRPEVMDGWLQVMKDTQPDVIIIGGDAIDMPEISKYSPDSRHFLDTMQLSIDGLHKYFSRLRADNPNAEIVDLDSNHIKRFNNTMIRNAMPMFGVKPANMPESWAVNSYPFLLRLDELGIKFQSSYKMNDRLMTIHGELANKNSTAALYLARYAISMLFHHDHRRGSERRVFPNGTAIEAFGFGTQCDVTGPVPSHGNEIDNRGYVVEKYENWDNGGGFVEYSKGDKPFRFQAVPIEAQDDYKTVYNKRVYKARAEVISALAKGQ